MTVESMALHERLGDLLTAQAHVTAAAGFWIASNELSPVILLEHLGGRLRELQAAVGAALEEAIALHARERDRAAELEAQHQRAELEKAAWAHAAAVAEREPEVVLGRWDNVA